MLFRQDSPRAIHLKLDGMDLVLLSLISFSAFFLSIITGGGSPLILIPVISLLFGLESVAPIITIGLLFSNLQRVYLFADQINWPTTRWYAPGAVPAAILGAYFLTKIHLEGLQIIVGIIFILLAINFLFRSKSSSSSVQSWHFLPTGLLNAIASSLIGSTGSVMNPLYLGFGLNKNEFVATKSLHNVILHLVKITAYLGLGALNRDYFIEGLVLGLSSFPANILGKMTLARIGEETFSQLIFFVMAISGTWMIWSQKIWLSAAMSTGIAEFYRILG